MIILEKFYFVMHPIFKRTYAHPLLSEKDLETLAAAHEPIRVSKGTILLKEAKIANEYYILETGLIKAFVRNYNNDEITTEYFTSNELVIAPASLFQRIPSQETLESVTDAVLWKIGFEAFQQLYHALPGFREWGRVWFSQQLFAVKQRSLDMVTQSATSRYLKLVQQKPEIVQQVPLKQIASYLGVTDTSLSRIRKEIVKTGSVAGAS